MTTQSRGPSNSHHIDKPYPTKAAESARLAAEMAEWEAEHGAPPLARRRTSAEIIAGVPLRFSMNGKPMK